MIVGYEDLNLEFYLINKDDYWLDKNFQFLQAFYAGTQWLQYPMGFIKGPNVYNVLCPGRFHILWASVGSTITCEGKLRYNKSMFNKYGKYIKSITADVLWPDFWKIEINIKDLTPNNFNMYMNYYKNGYADSFEIARVLAKNHTWLTGINTDYNTGLREERINARKTKLGKMYEARSNHTSFSFTRDWYNLSFSQQKTADAKANYTLKKADTWDAEERQIKEQAAIEFERKKQQMENEKQTKPAKPKPNINPKDIATRESAIENPNNAPWVNIKQPITAEIGTPLPQKSQDAPVYSTNGSMVNVVKSMVDSEDELKEFFEN